MKSVVVIVALLAFWSSAIAQEWAKASLPAVDQALKIGDRIPFTELHNMINYPKKTLKFSDHKPKLIILDFWGVQCTPCVKFWPTALKLQQEFGNDLQFILVDKFEDEKVVKDFMAKRKRITGLDMNLPMSCRDTTLWKLFPATDVPRYVWIGSDGVIGAVTGTKEVNAENIKKWITSGSFKMGDLKEDNYYSARQNQPIFVNGNGGDRSSDVFIWSSSLTEGQKDLGAEALIFHEEGFGYGIISTGSSIFSLYGHAYNNRLREWDYFDFLPLSRMELIAKDTSKYHWSKTERNYYNYQLLSGVPKSREQLLKMMQDDLRRYFELDVKWEKRSKKCLVLSMFDSTKVKRKSLGVEVSLRDMDITIDRYASQI